MTRRILGIETSCDETAAAILDLDSGTVLSSVVQSQIDLHRRYGGVVPEIAGRSHVEHMQAVLAEALEQSRTRRQDVAAVAVTFTPGLIGSLLVGVSAAKAVALALGVPLIPIHHVEAHVFSCLQMVTEPALPAAVLVASGGHSSLFEVTAPIDYRLRGETIDDAPGEAFDKVAALLGLPYPGGPSIERCAAQGNATRYDFPRSLLGKTSLDFSFSGLKTAVLYHCRGPKGREPRELSAEETADVAASFQAAVAEVLVTKLIRLARQCGARSLGVGGGVAANGALRRGAEEAARQESMALLLAPRELTTDNAIMVAGLGRLKLARGQTAGLDLDAYPSGTPVPPALSTR